MSIISTLLGTIKAKRQEKFASVAEQYDAAVLALAKGEEVDADALAEMLDALDKSDDSLEIDIADKQRRLEAAAELKRLSEVSKHIPSKELELSRLNDEITAYVAARKPKIQALSEELKMLRLDVDRRGYLESDLLSVGVPLALAQRRQALKTRQDELFRKQSQYDEMTGQAKRNVDAAKVRLADVESRLSKATIPYDRELIGQEIEALKKRIEAYSGQITAWEPLRLEIEQEQASVNEESSEIRRALMNP